MLLETKGDYEMANRIAKSLNDIAKELKRANDIIERMLPSPEQEDEYEEN